MASRLPHLAAIGLVLAAVAAPAGPALAGLPGACPDGDGVTVVVDFQELGGPTQVRCAPGPQPTGLAALKNAGFRVTGTARWGEAFICRIEGRPGAATESCIDTPPASAYWSYWHAPEGGSWTYSQHGVAYRTPPPGSFEGWSFALDKPVTDAPPPRVAPRRPPAPEQPAPPPAPPRATASQPAGSPTEPAGRGDGPYRTPGAVDRAEPAPASPPAIGGPASPATAATPTTAPTPAGLPAPRSPGSDPAIDPDTAASRSGPASPLGVAVGLGLLLALVVAAGVTVRRRRASG